MLDFNTFAQNAGQLLDFIGIVVILAGTALSILLTLIKLVKGRGAHALYKSFRNSLARSILLGLEFLIAGDIIRSVAGDINLESVIILGIIVIIRTIISMEFELEINGRWPWQRTKKS